MLGANARIEVCSQPTVIYGLGEHLRNLATSGEADLYLYGDAVLRALYQPPEESLPIFVDTLQAKTCASKGLAQVIRFPQRG